MVHTLRLLKFKAQAIWAILSSKQYIVLSRVQPTGNGQYRADLNYALRADDIAKYHMLRSFAAQAWPQVHRATKMLEDAGVQLEEIPTLTLQNPNTHY